MAGRTPELTPAGGRPLQARPLGIPREKITRRLLVDRLARRLVTLGGVSIIASILAILIVIVVEVAPLFRAPSVERLRALQARVSGTPLGIGVDEHQQIAYLVTAAGIELMGMETGAAVATTILAGLNTASVVSTSALGRGTFALGLSDGRVIPAEVRFNVTFPEGRRKVTAEVVPQPPIVIDADGRPIQRLAYAVTGDGPIMAATAGGRDLILTGIRERKALVGPATREVVKQRVSLPGQGEITALAADNRGDGVFVGMSSGELVVLRPAGTAASGEPDVIATVPDAGSGSAITMLGLLLGDRTLVAGDATGRVTSWQLLRDGQGATLLTKIYEFDRHDGPVIGFSRSQRDKGFLTADAAGNVALRYGTNGRTLLRLRAEQALSALVYAPKVDALLTAGQSGRVEHWAVRNPHPEITLRSLFGRVWYEGYTEPAYVWQSTGATDDFESKLSLTPLIYGTLKGTFYALLFAIPLALFGALYASQFMHPMLKGLVKPVVEIMAALPSVVLGFLAGLWLAPRVEKVVPGIFLMPLVIAALVLVALAVWRLAPPMLRKRVRPGTEVFLLIPIVVAGGWIAFRLGALLELTLLGGDYRGWLLSALGLTYDQRNSLVVGLAMGFAVVPIIFTIADDALSNVPPHLTAGSLALGANRWQTAVRVVLPTASPGIFSAVMIGFGRAVGETMIVLMATGNTPVMDWSIFNGFRALSANVAVELPEAPYSGTLYRVLFLAALLLFVMTFVVNTAAEIVRLRLRRRYQLL
ncbi:MAG TPA: ABC transporter permease subunit [bacterium]|nr:ABC transporter permease subunit [bacterium]